MLLPKVNIPSSPEAALLGRFGDIPIGYYTGTANISIPLYTIKEGSVEIPISLNYHGSGIKVADEATWVGLGWDLSPGGAIIQEVRGKKDDEDNNLYMTLFPDAYATFKSHLGPIETGAYYSAFQTGDCLKQPSGPPWGPPVCGTYEDASTILYKLQEGCGQPDVYHYSFNGYSGKFYINPETHQVVMMDKKDMIYFEKLGTVWKATTLDGTVFLFDIIETSHAWVVTEVSGVTYKLSQVTLLNGKSVNFTYTDEQSISEIYRENLVFDEAASGHGAYIRDHTYSNKKTLSSITTSDAVVSFNLENRDDILYNSNNIKRLKSVDIKSLATNKKVKSFEFGYSYFSYNLIGAPRESNGLLESYTAAHLDGYGKRLKLESVKEIGYGDNENPVVTKPPYQFNYNTTTTMPLKNSYAVDFWGYYNGQENAVGLIPDLRYFDYEHDTRYLDLYPIIFPYVGANRYSDNALAGVNMLKKITYPTGGYTEFEYEPNSFTNQFIPDKTKIDLAHKSVHLIDNNDFGNVVHNTFQLSKGVTISFQNSIVASNVNQPPWTYQDMQGCYIKFTKSKMVNGSPVVTLIKQWDLSTVLNVDFTNNNGKQWNEDIRVEYDADPTLSYQVDVYMPDNLNYPTNYYHSAGVNSWFSYFDDTGVDITTSNTCGLRIKSIKNYTTESSLANYKSITYYDGKLLDKFEPIQTMFAVYTHQDDPNPYNVLTTFRKRTWISSGDLAGGGGNAVGYGKVEETELAAGGNDNNGKNIYFYFNEENLRRKGFPSSAFIKNGLLTKQQVFNKVQNKLLEKEYNYANLIPFSCYSGIIINNHIFGPVDWPSSTMSNDNPYVPRFTYKFSYGIYPLISEWNKLQSVTTREYSGANLKSSTESYTYNSEGNISTVTTNNSKAESLITKYYYPQDYMINFTTDQTMINTHNTGTPVITEQYKGTTLLTRQKTVYGAVASAPNFLPQYIYSQKGYNPEEKRVTINSYDNKGNITQYTEESNIPVSIVWNADKTLPLAKIENATYASLLALPGGLSADFRTSLPGARVTSYTYKPLIGVNTVTDINNKTLSYEYDAFGRLILVRDWNNNIIKKICYNYAGEPENCTITENPILYSSQVKSGTFIRNNCSQGYSGTSVTYTVAAGAYTSLISQQDADQQAQNDVNNNGQAYANNPANGATCIACTASSYSPSSGWTSYYYTMNPNSTIVYITVVVAATSLSSFDNISSGGVYTGTISSNCYLPSVARSFTCSESGRVWSVTIHPSGQVQLFRIGGSALPSPYQGFTLTGSYSL